MRRTSLLAFLAVPALFAACGSGTGQPPRLDIDAGATSIPYPLADGAVPDAGEAGSGFTLRPNPPPPSVNALPSGSLLLTASGEVLAQSGYNFPAVNAGDAVFADGWEVRFDHVIATFDKITLSQNPDRVPTDQSQTGGVVAELDGPWAVDLHQNGAGYPYIDGKEPGSRAVAFALLTNQNRSGGDAFPTDGTRFAVGFSAVVATPNALDVNLGPDGLAAYGRMVQRGCVVLYTGQATWKGNVSPGVCVAPGTTAAGGIGAEPEFANLPTVVRFDLCFKPAAGNLHAGDVETTYSNCDNQDNDPAPGFDGEPHQRGVAFKPSTFTVGEITFHTDHPFWESTKHDTPARFDPFAAQVAGAQEGGVPTVHLEQLIGVDYTGFKDAQGNPLPWRTCDPHYQNPSGSPRVGQMHFDPVAVPHCAGGDHASGLCDAYDLSKYDQSTQGHWNGADGLCFVKRSYPSPP